ncbi:MAG: NeuD/PglB/VioB family sugar acetyltransferase [Patescibacteria group bacterium]
MQNKIYILGDGGMAREVFQIFKDLKKESMVVGFLINRKSSNKNLPRKVYNFKNFKEKKAILINGIGSPLRSKWITELEGKFSFAESIHPSTFIGENVNRGRDLVVSPGAILTRDISIGKHVLINIGATINHDCFIGNFVTISPGVNIAGKVSIGEGSFIGIGAIIIHGIKIGKHTIIGAGSVVVSDIPDNSLVYGNPAKVVRRLTEKDWEELL